MTELERSGPAGSRVSGAVAYLLFFLSGAPALVYEVSWSRQVGLVIGNTAAAAAVVLASCFTGLAAGQYVAARLASRVRPLLGYGVAELLAGLWAALVPGVLALAERGTGSDAGAGAATEFSAVWCFFALLPASVAIGATLPFIAEHVTRRSTDRGRRVAAVYGLNALGGLVGVVAATAFLVPVVGVRASGYAAGAASAGIGLVACVFGVVGRPNGTGDRPERVPRSTGTVPSIWWGLVAVSGFGTLGLEVLYTRLFALVLHNSTYTFGIVVAVFLAGLGLASVLVAVLLRWTSARRVAAASLALGAVAVAGSVVAFVRVTGLEYLSSGDSFTAYALYASGLAALVVLPPVVLLGMVLPAALAAAGGCGRSVGRLVAVNTVAAVAGALACGFLLAPGLGLWEAFGVVAFLFGFTAVAVAFRAGRPMFAICTGAAVVVAATVTASSQALVPVPPGEEVVRRWDTAYGRLDVVRSHKDGALTVRQNLHYRHGSTGRTALREYRQGRLPLLLHPGPTDAAFLGLGTGLTAAPVVADRAVERATVVELIPQVVEAARVLSFANAGVVDSPKVDVHVGDARTALRRAAGRFDVVVSDLFVPWESRAGYLYTVEFYRAARRALKPGGLFCQWLALYQVGPAEFELVADSFAAAFPCVTLWWGQFDARFAIVALVGSEGPLEFDLSRLENRWAALGDSPGGADPELASPADLPELFLGRWPRRESVVLNTDERPRLEFLAPLSHRAGRTLTAEKLRTYFDGTLAELPADGVHFGGWPVGDVEPTRRRARQRMNLLGP